MPEPSPPQRLSQLILSLWVPQAVYAAAELGVADALSEKPLTASAVAQKLGTHPDATHRLLRALRTLGILAEKDGVFELTELGRCLESGSATSRRAWCRLMGSPPCGEPGGISSTACAPGAGPGVSENRRRRTAIRSTPWPRIPPWPPSSTWPWSS